MAIGFEITDIIVAATSVVVFITVFLLVFKFRKKNKATKVQEKEVKASVVSAPIVMKRENNRVAAPEKTEMPETADLKLEDSLPEPARSNKPEITGTQGAGIQSQSYEFSDKTDEVKPSGYENITEENEELRLEDELPQRSIGAGISELKTEICESSDLKLEDDLPENASYIEDPVPETGKPENDELELEDTFPENIGVSQTAKIGKPQNQRKVRG